MPFKYFKLLILVTYNIFFIVSKYVIYLRKNIKDCMSQCTIKIKKFDSQNMNYVR